MFFTSIFEWKLCFASSIIIESWFLLSEYMSSTCLFLVRWGVVVSWLVFCWFNCKNYILRQGTHSSNPFFLLQRLCFIIPSNSNQNKPYFTLRKSPKNIFKKCSFYFFCFVVVDFWAVLFFLFSFFFAS
jgi:hypothetical protein